MPEPTTDPTAAAPDGHGGPCQASTEDWCERAPNDGHAWSYTHHAGTPTIETRTCYHCGYLSVQPVREALADGTLAGSGRLAPASGDRDWRAEIVAALKAELGSARDGVRFTSWDDLADRLVAALGLDREPDLDLPRRYQEAVEDLAEARKRARWAELEAAFWQSAVGVLAQDSGAAADRLMALADEWETPGGSLFWPEGAVKLRDLVRSARRVVLRDPLPGAHEQALRVLTDEVNRIADGADDEIAMWRRADVRAEATPSDILDGYETATRELRAAVEASTAVTGQRGPDKRDGSFDRAMDTVVRLAREVERLRAGFAEIVAGWDGDYLSTTRAIGRARALLADGPAPAPSESKVDWANVEITIEDHTPAGPPPGPLAEEWAALLEAAGPMLAQAWQDLLAEQRAGTQETAPSATVEPPGAPEVDQDGTEAHCRNCGVRIGPGDFLAPCPDCDAPFCTMVCWGEHRALGTCPDHADGVLATPSDGTPA